MRYVSVRNLERFQHYTKRRPPWVKWYTSVLKDEHMASLSPGARLVYALMLLVAAEHDNRVPEDAGWLAVEMMLPRKLIASSLAELLATEYLIPASTIASNGASPTSTETGTPENREQRTEKNTTRTTSDVGVRS